MIPVGPGLIHAQQIHTIVDADSVRVGDMINVSVVLEGNYSLQSYPDSTDFSDELELLSRERYQAAANRDSIVYRLQYFGVEDLVIDPLEFNLRVSNRDTTLRTSRIPLFFKSTLTSQEEELRPLKPIFDFARSYWPFILLGILLIILGVAIARYLKERAKRDTFIPETFREEEFINPLDELEKDIVALQSGPSPSDRDEFEAFYVRLADSIRRYLKRVYDFPALEMTTGEIIRELQRERASSELIRDVKKVLRDADMVKFAKFNPASDQVSDAIRTGLDFLETARSVDIDRVEYLEYQHNEEQEALRQTHIEEQQELKQEFEQ
ncbi:hypothetical protein [Rhodohalobacter sp. 8-1]|uniref:hypothetical protein n=1 Tax=Rhodohalobacter sp. 8-1 TaxID=3131972 RepID=UPI0030ED1D9B